MSDEEKINKLWKSVKTSTIIVFVLQIIISVVLNSATFILSIATLYIPYIISLILIWGMFIATIIGCHKHKRWGAILGIILSLIYLAVGIYAKNWIHILLAALLFIEFIRLNISIAKNK